MRHLFRELNAEELCLVNGGFGYFGQTYWNTHIPITPRSGDTSYDPPVDPSLPMYPDPE